METIVFDETKSDEPISETMNRKENNEPTNCCDKCHKKFDDKHPNLVKCLTCVCLPCQCICATSCLGLQMCNYCMKPCYERICNIDYYEMFSNMFLKFDNFCSSFFGSFNCTKPSSSVSHPL